MVWYNRSCDLNVTAYQLVTSVFVWRIFWLKITLQEKRFYILNTVIEACLFFNLLFSEKFENIIQTSKWRYVLRLPLSTSERLRMELNWLFQLKWFERDSSRILKPSIRTYFLRHKTFHILTLRVLKIVGLTRLVLSQSMDERPLEGCPFSRGPTEKGPPRYHFRKSYYYK